jgi:hypothetical protein
VILVYSKKLIDAVEAEIESQIENLPEKPSPKSDSQFEINLCRK